MITSISKLSPLRWIDTSKINQSFDGNFFRDQIRFYQSKQAFYQKFQRSDSLVLQVVADSTPNDLDVVSCETNDVFLSVTWNLNPLSLSGLPNLSIYEISLQLTALPEGNYYFSQDQFTSEPIDVKNSHESTMLIKYKNSRNDYDIVFDTGIEFQFRVESALEDFEPQNDRSVYFDQTRNATQLSSYGYRKFTYKVGYGFGVPYWVLDKVNLITQCDQLSINDVPYQVFPEANWETTVNNDKNYIGGSIELTEVFNKFTQYVTGQNPNQEFYEEVRRKKSYTNVGADFSVSGVFTALSDLEKVVVVNRGTSMTLNFGFTSSGSEIGSYEATQGQTVYTFDEFDFINGQTTVYVSGIPNGADFDIYFVYDQLDAEPIPVGSGGTSGTSVGKGATAIWTEIDPGDFDLYWDRATGLGKSNTSWFNWAISGTAGTKDFSDHYIVGANFNDPNFDPSILHTVIGANMKAVPKSALPAEGVKLFTGAVGSDGNITADDFIARAGSVGASPLNYEMKKGGSSSASLGKSSNLGSGEASFDVRPSSRISLFITKLNDN